MAVSAVHRVNAGGTQAAVPQEVCKTDDILFNAVKCPCKQMAQVMRKHLLIANARLLAERFHFLPYIASVKWLAALCYEHRSGCDAGFFHIFL